MSFSKQFKKSETKEQISQNINILAGSSLVGATLTFLIGISTFTQTLKIVCFLVIVTIQSGFYAFFLFKFRRFSLSNSAGFAESEAITNELSLETTDKLKALREAVVLTGGALKTNDLFGFICKRLEDIFRFSNAVLILPESSNSLKIKQALGTNAGEFLRKGKVSSTGIAGRSLASGQPEIDRQLDLEQMVLAADLLANLKIAAAVPLRKENGEAFGVLVFYGEAPNDFAGSDFETLRIVSEIVSPLFKNSLDHEQSMESALTDPLTKLANERAFYLILENQLAESQRKREGRPLSVLVADICNFEKSDSDDEPSASVESIGIAAEILKSQLREMDFVARIGAEEFAMILPTATAEIAASIIERVNQAAAQKSAEISSSVKLAFNFGAATFYQDGETGQELYQTALVRKDQAKKGDKSVVWFAKKQPFS